MNTITKDIIEKAQYGDHESLNKVLKPLSQFAYYKSIKILRNKDDAEECVQNVLNSTAQNLHKYNFKDGSFINWCIVLIDNEISNRLRTKDRLEAVVSFNDDYALSYPDQLNVSSELRIILSELEKIIGEEDYKILFYRIGHQYKFSQIAKMLGCSEITAKRRFYAALKHAKVYSRRK